MASEAVMVELPIAVDTGQFRPSNGQFFVPVSAKIASSALQWAKKSGQHEAKFDFLYELREMKSRKRCRHATEHHDGATRRREFRATLSEITRLSGRHHAGAGKLPAKISGAR